MAFEWLQSELADWLLANQLTINRIENKVDKLMALVKVQSEDLATLRAIGAPAPVEEPGA